MYFLQWHWPSVIKLHNRSIYLSIDNLYFSCQIIFLSIADTKYLAIIAFGLCRLRYISNVLTPLLLRNKLNLRMQFIRYIYYYPCTDNGCTAPSHFLHQCWNIVHLTLLNKLHVYWNYDENTKLFTHENASKNIVCEMATILSRGRWVKLFSSDRRFDENMPTV